MTQSRSTNQTFSQTVKQTTPYTRGTWNSNPPKPTPKSK